jgi:hypothetical protein
MIHNQRSRVLILVPGLLVFAFVMALGWRAFSKETMAQVRTANQSPATRQRWEYCTILSVTPGTAGWKAQVARGGIIETMDSDLSGTTTLNKLGADGWELVSVSHQTGNSAEYFLKRPSSR